MIAFLGCFDETTIQPRVYGMKNTLKLFFFAAITTVMVGCSTSSKFVIPAGHTLKVTDRPVVVGADGEWKTSPFFWDTTGGAPFYLYDSSGKMVRQGKLKMQFRVASIFWPPFALIYWPMGLNKQGYDLSKPGDGYLVRDEQVMASSAAPAAAAAAPAPAATPAAKAKKAKAPKAAATPAAEATPAK